MRVPVYESQATLDTGAGSMPNTRIDDAPARALQGVGQQISALGEAYQRQKEASEDLATRGKLLDFNRQLASDYRTTVESAPATGEGLYEGWFVSQPEQPSLYNQREQEFLQQVPERLKPEYELRLKALRADYEDRLAGDELKIKRNYATTVVDQQLEGAQVAVLANPDAFDDYVTDIDELIDRSVLTSAQKAEEKARVRGSLAGFILDSASQAMPEETRKRIDSHLGLQGSPVEALVEKIVGVESGGNPTAKNPKSTATGAGQFIEGTWLQFIREVRPDIAKLPRSEQLEYRNDPGLSRDAVAWYAQGNARRLSAAGAPVTAGTLYLAHFAGPEGAVKILQASPDATVDRILGASVVKANPFLSGRNAGWVVQWADKKMQGGRTPRPDPLLANLPPEDLLKYRETTYKSQASMGAMENERLKFGIQTGDVSSPDVIIQNDILDFGQKASLLKQLDTELEKTKGVRRALGELEATGRITVNPFDNDSRKAADDVYERLEDDPASLIKAGEVGDMSRARLGDYVARTGYLPQRAAQELRMAINSGDAQTVARAASVAADISATYPNSFNGDNAKAVKEAADTFRVFRNYGLSEEMAAARLISRNDPETIKRTEALLKTDAYNAEVKKIDDGYVAKAFADGNPLTFNPDVGANDMQRAAAISEYRDIHREAMIDAQGDIDMARQIADERFRRVWNVSDMHPTGSGSVVWLPPEATYPSHEGSHDYIRDQALEALQEQGVSADEVFLEAYEETPASRDVGRPLYRLEYTADGRRETFPQPFYAIPPEGAVFDATPNARRRARNMEVEQERQESMSAAQARRTGGVPYWEMPEYLDRRNRGLPVDDLIPQGGR